MEFRKAYPTDAYLLVGIRNTVWKNTYYDLLPNSILYKMKSHMGEMVDHLRDQILENNRIIVALDDQKKVVGYIFYAKSQLDLYENAAEIREVFVLPDYQGKGIGRKLYELAKEEIKKLGYLSLVLCCPSVGSNKEFFAHLGGKEKKIIEKDFFGYSILCCIYYFGLEDSFSIQGEWSLLYEEAQKKLYLLNDDCKEIAVILSSNGNFYFGLGLDSQTYSVEVALSNFLLHQEEKIVKILILDKSSNLLLPCGKCLDLLLYFHQGDAEVLFEMGDLKSKTIKELNPYYQGEINNIKNSI